jgi:oxygen-independent coproporphyrinogen-3 oxidase
MPSGIATPLPLVERAAGLYLHIPFCRTKCHYCDFNTYAGLDDLIPNFVEALGQQIARGASETERQGRRLVSVFFGGGTPSLLSGRQVGGLLDAAAASWGLPEGIEITLEANPGTLSRSALLELRAAGVTRLSLGAQTLQPRGLVALGREHTVDDLRQSVVAARAAGFDNLNLDLIYGWMNQTSVEWEADLAAATALDVEHLSLYPLTVESGTPLAAMVKGGQARVADDDTMATAYDMAVARLDQAGYTQYEVSNWARRVPGAPTRGEGSIPPRACQHNLLYWRNQEYWAGGPGAHAHWAGRRWMVVRSPRRYIAAVRADHPVMASSEDISPQLAQSETMLLGLRLSEGVALVDFADRHGARAEVVFAEALAALTRDGLIEQVGDRLLVPQAYRYILDGIVARFLPDVEEGA